MAAAAIVTNTQGKGGGDSPDEHFHYRPIKVDDPVELYTCTVEAAFRRMEELVGSEEEEKNWRGIVIALAVIAFILGMIALAIVLVSPNQDIYDPGSPLPLSMLTDDSLQLRRPGFNWVRGSDNYVLYIRREVNATDKFEQRYATLTDISTAGSESILVSQAVMSSKMRGAEEVTASPNTIYALVKLNSQTDSIITQADYLVFDQLQSKMFKLSDKRLQHAAWIGTEEELVYIEDNNIYYKERPDQPSQSVTSDGSSVILNGLPDRVYRAYIFPNMESLVWISPTDSKFVFAKINTQEAGSYQTEPSHSSISNRAGSATLYVFDKETRQLNLPSTQGYLTAVTWMDASRVLVVWLSADHQTEQYIICQCKTGQCQVNYEYKSSALDLNWVGLYGTPVYNSKRKEYYTLLPDPAIENKLYRHVAAIKEMAVERRDPDITFLTSHYWSDVEILALDEPRLYFLSTGSNFTHQHLYSLNISSRETVCLSCQLPITRSNQSVSYVEASFSHSSAYIYLSILGPDIPTFHVLKTDLLYTGNVANTTQIDKWHYDTLITAYENIKLPQIEYLTVPLDHGAEASVKLVLPSIFNRAKGCKYETIIIINNMPGSRTATQQFHLGFQEYLAKNQTYIIALVDVRGAGGRGEKLRQAIHGQIGVVEARDISNVTSYLMAHSDYYKVDEDYIAVMGKDYGGFVSLYAATNASIECVITESPTTSLQGGWFEERYMHNATTSTELIYECLDTSAYCAVPQVANLLLLHGTDDALVPVKNSMNLMRDLQRVRYIFQQQIYPDVGNNLEQADISVHYYQTIISYLKTCFHIEERIDDSKIDFCANR